MVSLLLIVNGLADSFGTLVNSLIGRVLAITAIIKAFGVFNALVKFVGLRGASIDVVAVNSLI